MKQAGKISILFSTLWLIILTVLPGAGAASAQIVTHRRDIKLPGQQINTPHLALNDSGLGATDLDMGAVGTWKSRYLVTNTRLYAMLERGDGTAYFGVARVSDVTPSPTAVVERHINTNSSYSDPALFGMIASAYRYNLIGLQGQVLARWLTGLPSARAIVYGGNGTSIVCTGESFILNGIDTRLVSIDQNTREITPFSGDVVGSTGQRIGEEMQMAYGADDMLYLFDHDNLRILKFDTGVRGGTRGAYLSSFDLDPVRPAINAITVDLAGNFYVGSDNGGINIYGADGQWKQNVEGIFRNDPNLPDAGYKPYLNYYASGLNDGNGTLDVRDVTGYRQYTITAPGQTPPIRITSEPQAQTIRSYALTNLSVSAVGNDEPALTHQLRSGKPLSSPSPDAGTPLIYQWRKNGVELTDGGTISGATTANLSISSTVPDDAGYYDVLVRKPGAIVTSQAAIITVLPPTAANVSVSGRVWTPNSRGLMNATVNLIDVNGHTRHARTNAFGYFQFDDVPAGQTYIVDVKSKSYSFAPQIVTVMGDLTALNFSPQ